MSPVDLYTLAITCRSDQVEAVADAFEEAALALSLLAAPREETARVEALLDFAPPKAWVLERLAPLEDPSLAYTLTEVGDLDWIKKVAQDFPPLSIARWTVYGAAHRDKITDFSQALQIDATSAFGTGEHPTTRGCLEALDRFLVEREGGETSRGGLRALDVGCGSGILAMALVKAVPDARAVGVDMDGPSVRIAKENAETNGVSDRIIFAHGRGYAPASVGAAAPYDLIMANIFADPLRAMAGDLVRHLRGGGRAILSGLLNEQAEEVIEAHVAHGLTLVDHRRLGAWSVLALSAPI